MHRPPNTFCLVLRNECTQRTKTLSFRIVQTTFHGDSSQPIVENFYKSTKRPLRKKGLVNCLCWLRLWLKSVAEKCG